MNVNFSRVTSAAAALLPLISSLFAVGLVTTSAAAQPPTPTEAQSQVNPFPKAGGNTQNRGRASDDKYWGITDANFLWNQSPLARIPNQNGTETVGLSGYTFPQAINTAGDGRRINLYGAALSSFTNPGITLDNVVPPLLAPGTVAPLLVPFPLVPVIPGATNSGTLWTTTAGPSENPVAANYSRTPAVPRTTAAATDYIAANPNALFTWYPNVPGDVGVIRRYAIRVILPSIVDETTEVRISDARYTVFYSFRDRAGALQNRTKVCFVSQASNSTAGAKYLSDSPNGTPAYFPFFSDASYGTAAGPSRRAQVVLDNTTADTPSIDQATGLNNQYVLADALQFEQRAAVVSSTPTIVKTGGGRKTAAIATTVAGSRQPGSGPNYQIGDNGTVATVAGGVIMPNSAYGTNGFVGDPRDATYSGNPNDFSVLFMGPEAYVRPKVLPEEYDGQYPFTRVTGTYPPILQPSSPFATFPAVQPVPPTVLPADLNESVGTRVQIDPASFLLAGAFPNVPIQAASANNFQSYRLNANAAPDYKLTDPVTANKPVPLFSQVQVILARTVFVPDPEIGVSNNNLDGTRTIEVGEVLGLDWQTGAQIWRFPDRTYLPQRRPGLELLQPFSGLPVPGQGLRNPIIGYEQRPIYTGNTIGSYTDVLQRPINQVPGIQGYDVNGNGVIDDNEVFIAPQGGNAGGGLASSVTIAGQIPVNGDVQIPVYNVDSTVPPPFNNTLVAGVSTNVAPDNGIIGVTTAPAGRYKPVTGAPDPLAPVLATVAYVASNNGVVYAFDPHGNNDNAYTEQEYVAATAPALPLTPRRVGRFRPGTTNVLWTFNANSLPRLRAGQYVSTPPTTPPTQNESVEQYNKRLFGEVPATLGFGGASPVISYRKDEDDTGIIRRDEEPRLFVGNQNGVMYAVDASARSLSATAGTVGTLPFHKGEQPANTVYAVPSLNLPTPGAVANVPADSRYRLDLKWWFETEAQSETGGGAINSAAAVSINRMQAGTISGLTTTPALVEKGVYFTSVAGRVYCVDWTGPVSKDFNTLNAQIVGHDVSFNWNGRDPSSAIAQAGFPPVVSAEPAIAYAASFNLNDNYRFHNQRAATNLARPDNTEGNVRPRWVYPSQYYDTRGPGYQTSRQPDKAESVPGVNTYKDGATAPIYGAPALLDFPWTNPTNSTTTIRHLVAVAANDRIDGNTTPTSGKVYLLDQAGDRRDFLTNPQKAPGSPSAIAYSSPIDQYSVLNEALGSATPAWTYRFQYGTYDAQQNLITQDPTTLSVSINHGTKRLGDASDVGVVADFGALAESQPSRRILPTLFFGSAGRMYAIDFDLATGLFTRWRPTGTAQPVPMPYANGAIRTDVIPADIPAADPNNEVMPWINTDLTTSIAGNLRFRPILARTVALIDPSSVDGSITISGGPLQTRDSYINAGAGIAVPTSPSKPTNDPPVLSPPGVGMTAAALLARFQTTPGIPVDATRTTDRAVNQEIDDPLATTRGSRDPETTAFGSVEPDPVADRSFQFPTLFVTTAGASTGLNPVATGGLYEISTNLDGEDTDTITTAPVSSFGTFAPQTASRGWAFTTDLLRFNDFGHVYQLGIVSGAGGSGSGVSILTPAYFSGTDPATNYITGEPATPLPGEPAVTVEGFGGVLKPIGTGVLLAATNLNPNTGQVGLPLDANGLYFDKNVAVRFNPATATVDPAEPYATDLWRWGGRNSVLPDAILDPTDDDGQIRLPGYSTPALRPNPVVPVTDSNQLADGIRPDYNRDGTGTATNPNLRNNDDFNPTAQNAVWIYSGGADGALYAYTPALPVRFGGDGGSGLFGGTPTGQTDPYQQGSPKIELIHPTRVAGLRSGNVRPQRDTDSVIGQKGKNFYEWGEKVYIAVYDVAKTAAPATPRNPFQVNPRQEVSVEITDNNGRVIDTVTGNLGLGSYAPNANYFPGRPVPAGGPAAQAQLGVAILTYNLTQGSAQTPGIILRARLSQATINNVINTSTGTRFASGNVPGGATDAQISETTEVPFQIANPLAIQSFIKDTQGNPSLPSGANATHTANSIGPFDTNPDAKNKIATAAGTNPDDTGAYYSQALANGNQIRRFDITPYTTSTTGTGPTLLPNRNLSRRLFANDPTFSIPVVAGIGFGDHGKTASSDADAGRRYLRIANRSLLQNLRDVRVQVRDDIIWRTWPGAVPNSDATDGNILPDGTPSSSGGNNPRLTPFDGGGYLMRTDGIVNFLPWEQPVPEVQPWKRSAVGSGGTGAGGNSSQDYPDITARAQGALDNQVVSVKVNGIDLTAGQGSLLTTVIGLTNTGISQQVGGGDTRPVLTVPNVSIDGAAGNGNIGLTDQFARLALQNSAASLSVKIPKFQPANLVAMHSVTSTYLSPNATNDSSAIPQVTTGGGDVQLPQLAADRRLSRLSATTGLPTGDLNVAPFGYTTRLRVYIDSNSNGIFDDNEAYRDVETWMGVAVDQSLSANEKSPVEITGPTGGLAMGFGMQNGFLGYNQGGGAFVQGLLPAPLFDTTTFKDSPYKPFFAAFAVKNSGNVNMWNLRAAQKASSLSTGFPTAFYQLRSTTVDPLQGIFSVGADPTLGVMPQIVTSLDANLDTSWQTYFQRTTGVNPLLSVVDPTATTPQTIYQQYYAGLGGKHPLHKPRVGDPVDSGTLLSIPDVPSAQPLSTDLNVPLAPDVPVISVAVPIGTPSGTYGPVDTAPSDFYIFEDHDTEFPYSAVPILDTATGKISPAGPLYAGRNLFHPGLSSILPVTGTGILRPRTAATATANAELLPRTDPGIRLKVKVVEGAMTGQIVDQAAGVAGTTAVTTGILPFIDQQPLLDLLTDPANPRPAAALSPAAYRDVNGSLHTFFARNATTANAASTAAGQPYNLFVSNLLWNVATGQWEATNTGNGPVATSYGALPGGQWFTTPTIPAGMPGGSNTSPFVLQQTLNDGTGGDASLFLLNTALSASGRPIREIYAASLTPGNGGGVAVGTPAPLILNADPSLQRFGPRAAYDGSSNTTFVTYYGGVAGKWTLYYAAAEAGIGGLPTAATANRRERPFSLPLSITSASDPVPVLRSILEPVTNTPLRVVDLYYTGTSRTDRAPNIYMTRYRIQGSGDGARLSALSLVPRTREVLAATTGSGLYKARDIAWVRDGNVAYLPQIFIDGKQVTDVGVALGTSRWAYDDTTNLLYQKFQRAAPGPQGVTFIYADVSAGTVRFRGPGAPAGTETVSANYVPQTYRLTLDGVAATSVTGFFDDRTLLDSATENGLIQQTTAVNATNYIVRRPTANLVAGRTWLVWNQNAKGSSAAGLQMLTRRVGVDLKTVAFSGTNLTATGTSLSPRTDNPESMALYQENPLGSRIQAPQITGLTIDGADILAGGNYEVDAANGRIYVDPRYEGHRLEISYNAQPGAKGGPVQRTAVYDLAQIADLDPSVPSPASTGQGVPMQRSINENQPYVFLDRYDPRLTTTGRAAGAPNPVVDPITQPGRVWLFWTSPRGRTGVLRDGTSTITVNGFDVYWQTLAPFFDFSSYKP